MSSGCSFGGEPERLKDERPVMILQFYPPRDDKLKWRLGSNRVVVPLDTENGQRMDRIFARSKTTRELGESRYGLKDPDGSLPGTGGASTGIARRTSGGLSNCERF